jgi:hypothetical protein
MILMILLSQQGFAAAQIADLLGYDPATVRRWIHRYRKHGTLGWPTGPAAAPQRPRSGPAAAVHGWAAPDWASGPPIAHPAPRLDHPQAVARAGPPTAQPADLHRRVREVARWRRPRLVAKGDPDRDQILADLHQQITDLPLARCCWPRTRPTSTYSTCCPGPLDLDPQRAAAAGHDPGKNRRRTIFGAIDMRTGRLLYQVTRKPSAQASPASPASPASASTCWPPPRRASGRGDLRQPHHPPLQDRPTLADHPPAAAGAARGALQPPRQPGRADLGCAEGVASQWLANNPTLTIQGRVRQVHAFFRQRTTAQMLATAAPHSSPWLPEDYVQNFRQAA